MASNDEGKSYYGLGLDNSQLQAEARRASGILKGIGNSAEAEGARIDNAYKKIAGAASGYFTFTAAKAFIGQIVKFRGEIESLSISFETLLGNKQKADALFGQIKQYAVNTPMELAPLAKGAQTLLSFNIEAEKVMPILKQIGDISMGSADKFNSLVLAFSQMHSTGKLMGQDLLQMINAGFNPLTIIAEKTGKSIGALKEEMSAGAISADMVADAFSAATTEGGKFYGMLDKQSKGINGSISNLHGAIDDMMNDLGTKGQGVITSTIAGATSIVQHYEQIGKAIADMVIAYGSYKAALITLNAIQNLNRKILMQAVLEKKLAAAAGMQLSNAEAVAAARTKLLSLAQYGLVKALNAAKAAMLSNPYTLVAVAVAALAFGIYKLVTAETAAEAAHRKHNEALEAAREKKENLISKTQQLTNKINDETQTIYAQIKAWKELQKEMPETFGNMTMQEFKIMKPDDRDKFINKTADDREIIELNKTLEDSQKRVESLKKSIKEAETESVGMYKETTYFREKQLKEEEERLKLLIEEKKQMDEIIQKSEFEEKTDAEKLAILDNQLQKYRDQYAEIEKLVPESERVVDSLNKAVTPSISNIEKKIFEVNTEWEKFDFQTQSNITQLNSLNVKINEVSSTISAITTANGKGITYAEAKATASKAYADAKKLVDDITKNSKNYSQKAYEDAVSDLEAMKKAYQALGGDTTVKQKITNPHDYSEQIEREKQEMIRFYKDLEFGVEQARIDVMNEGAEKILAQNELNYKKELEQITRQKADLLKQIQEQEKTIWESQNPDWEKKGIKFTTIKNKLSEDEENPFKAISKGAEAKFSADNKKAYEDALKDYADFAKNYLDKVKEFNDNIKNLENQETSKETIESVKTMQAEILAGLDEEMNMKETTFVTFVDGMVGMGLEQLLSALKTAKEALQTELSSVGGDKAKVTQLQAQVKTLTNRINELSAVKDETKEVKAGDPAKKWQKTLSVMNDVKDITNDIADSFDGLDDSTKTVLESAMNIATGVINMIIGIQTLAVGAATATTATATTAASAISTVEKASVILAIISAAIQVVMAIVNVVKQFFNNDKKKEKEIQRLQEQVDTLKEAYEKLGKAIDKAYSADAKKLIEQQDENLRKQKKILEEQIRLEEDKKKTDKNTVQQYKDAIKEIDDELEKTQDRVIESIVGEDILSAIDDFAEAYIDALATTGDKAASIKETVRKMIKSAVTELIKSRLSPEVTAFMEYLATSMEDGILTVAEQNVMDSLESSIYNKLNGLDASLEKYVKDKQDEAREASSKGFASISQDSADELDGKFTAFTALTYSINEYMKILTSNSGRILQHLAGIESNTEACKRLDGMDTDLKEIKYSINDIILKGLTIKK
jgi:tape measure domain-containing protein